MKYHKTEKISIKPLASAIIHEHFKVNISETGEKECALFASMIESSYVAFREYHKELCSIPLTKEDIIKNADKIGAENLTNGQYKVLNREVKQVCKEISMKHKKTLLLFEQWLREFDRIPESQKDYLFDLVVKG